MTSKKICRTPTRESAVKRDLRTPKYKMRVVESKKIYTRKGQSNNLYYRLNRILRVLLIR